jgi:hypothetical protein
MKNKPKTSAADMGARAHSNGVKLMAMMPPKMNI